MSLSYAARLKKGVDYGVCGTPELKETPRKLAEKSNQLADMIKRSKYFVAMTGAGISTSTGIPDFRGPNGIWTKEQKGVGEELMNDDFRFEDANPSLTHMALLGLLNAGKLKFLISQNVDGLHIRSGFPRTKLAELHGNIFMEECKKCSKQFFRDFDVQSIGLKGTGRTCDECNGTLRDFLLDWDDPLPDDDLEKSEKHSENSDLMICLGTSLRVAPANKIPLLNQSKGGKLVICNLQNTPVDSKADLLAHAKCDQLMRQIMEKLKIQIPVYVRNGTFTIITEMDDDGGLTLKAVGSDRYYCPFIFKIEISLIGHPNSSISLEKHVHTHKWKPEDLPKVENGKELELNITVHFARGCTTRSHQFTHRVKPGVSETTQTLEITRIDYNIKPEKEEEEEPMDLNFDFEYEFQMAKKKRSFRLDQLGSDDSGDDSKLKRRRKGSKQKKNGVKSPSKSPKKAKEPVEEEQEKPNELVIALKEAFPSAKEEDIISALRMSRNSVAKAANYLLAC